MQIKGNRTRRLAAIMFTDIVGYTALMQQDENLAAEIRASHRREFNRYHEIFNGKILQYYGDGTLSVFQSGLEAVQCAVAIQKALGIGKPVPLRIGLHLGDIVFDGTEVYGDGVNLASRIESMSVAGAILVSGKLNAELRNHPEIPTFSLGQFELKNIADPVEVYSVLGEGLTTPSREDLKRKEKSQAKTIAVLPFVNMSSSEDNEYFSDGMSEEIINALAKIKGLKVTSRTSTFFYKNKSIPIPQIGQELNVSTILEGSIRLAGNKMRITAQLIDVAEDFHFWAESFDRSIDDIFAVQDEISLLIADRLREHIGHFDIGDHLVDTTKIPVEDYKEYLKGRYFLMKLNLPDSEKGIAILQNVIRKQPEFPMAYLDINQAYSFLGTMGLLPAHEAFAKAKPYLEKAIELNEDLPESQLNLAWISCWQNWDLESTYRHINIALEMRPSDVLYLTMANTLVLEGKMQAALNFIDKALQLDPYSGINHHFKGFIYYLLEQYEKAFPYFEKSLRLKPDLPFPHIYWGGALLLMGRKKESLKYFQNLPEYRQSDLTKLGGTTLAYAALGDTQKTEEGIAELEKMLQSEMMGSALNYLILCRTMTGEHKEALKLIGQGIENRLPLMLLLSHEPLLKPLRDTPHFRKLMEGMLGKEVSFVHSRRKYKQSLLNEELLEESKDKIHQLMSDGQPFLDPLLTLRDLADKLNIPANQLSQVLNEGFNKNFAEFINSYRIEAFKSKVADPAQRHLTILALAYDSGFNSKTVFNTFFKKATGMTPSAYWKEMVK